MEPVTLDLGKVQFTFGETSAWDFLAAQNELRDANGNVDGSALGLCMAWKSAVAGGFVGAFKDFCKQLPSSKIRLVVKTSHPFIHAPPEKEEPSAQVTSSTSSEPAAP